MPNNYKSYKLKTMLKSYFKQDNIAPTPTQHHLVLIILQRKISFVTSFTISKRLKSTNT